MLTISLKRLVSAIEEAEEFRTPDMDAGTAYLYENLYGRLSQDMDVSLSEIDFDAFRLEDVDNMWTLYCRILEGNGRRAEAIACTLNSLQAITAPAVYV